MTDNQQGVEMKKPKKYTDDFLDAELQAYNSAIDDYEKYHNELAIRLGEIKRHIMLGNTKAAISRIQKMQDELAGIEPCNREVEG